MFLLPAPVLLGFMFRAGPIPEEAALEVEVEVKPPDLPGSSLFDFDFKFGREGRSGLGWGPMWFGKDIRLR